MNKNIAKIFLLTILLVLLVGAVNATELSNDTTVHDTGSDIVQDTATATDTVEDSVIEEKINKENIEDKTLKASTSKTYDVKDFDTLHSALTSDTYNTVTINIKSNIKLTDNSELNEAIKTLTINGNGKTINGDNNYQFLYIREDSTVNIKNIKITNCYAEYGGAIRNGHGILTVINSTLNNNTAEDYGGATYSEDADVTISDCTFNYNRANYGGAITHNSTGNIKIINNNFANNSAEKGSAIYLLGHTIIGTREIIDNPGVW